MTSGGKHRQAVILSGGGANGAYEVGVLKALLTGQSPATDFQPLDPDIFTGTSVGAFNAALLVSPAAILDQRRIPPHPFRVDWNAP